MMGRHAAPLCFLTDFSGGEERLCAFLAAGVLWVQYRDKTSPRRILFERALRIRAVTRKFGALFIMNDHADIAAAVGADGVHLGQDDLPMSVARTVVGQGIIGISTHSVAEAVAAADEGADYIGFGPIFATFTKDAGIPKGIDAIRQIRSAVTIPIIAIGGITAEQAPAVIEAGSSGIAVASALQEGIPEESAKRFLDALKSAQGFFVRE